MSRSTYFPDDRSYVAEYQFYTHWDYGFLYNQAVALFFGATCVERSDLTEAVPDLFEQVESFENFQKSLRASLHFLELQQSEAIFALIKCSFQTLAHWQYMSSYWPNELKGEIRSLLAGDYKSFTGGLYTSFSEIVGHSVYAGYSDDRAREKWQRNIEVVCDLLKIAGHKFLASPEYLAFKHGIRLRTGGFSLRAGIEDKSGMPAPEDRMQTIFSAEDGVTFLDKAKGNQRQVRVTSKQISPEQSLNLLAVGSALLKTIRQTRLARLKGETRSEIQTVSATDVEAIRKLTPVTTMSMSFTA